jgi:hypothetical protein
MRIHSFTETREYNFTQRLISLENIFMRISPNKQPNLLYLIFPKSAYASAQQCKSLPIIPIITLVFQPTRSNFRTLNQP